MGCNVNKSYVPLTTRDDMIGRSETCAEFYNRNYAVSRRATECTGKAGMLNIVYTLLITDLLVTTSCRNGISRMFILAKHGENNNILRNL